MSKRNWRRVQPTSLRNAMELAKDHAREVKNLSVEGVADRMGLPDHFALYKWIAEARMPAHMIRPFEQAAGIDLVTRHLAHSAGGLFIPVPGGNAPSLDNLAELQQILAEAAAAVMGFYAHKHTAEEALGRVAAAMEGLAFHDRNIRAFDTPELPFGGEGQ